MDVIEIPSNVFNIINKDAKITILLTMDYQDIIHLCSSWKDMNNFCHVHSKRIWKAMIKKDFHIRFSKKNSNEYDYLKIYKDLIYAEDYYKRNRYRSSTIIVDLIRTVENNPYVNENFFGVKWLFEVKKKSVNNDALFWASRYGYVNIVKFLLDLPPSYNIDPSDRYNRTIIYASMYGHVEVAKLLLKDPRVNPSDNHNEAIKMASKAGHINIVKLLLDLPEYYYINPSTYNNYAIKMAYRDDHIEIVKLLLKDKRVLKILSDKDFERFQTYM